MTPQEKSDRLIEAAVAILDAAPNHRLNTVVLNKALFYLDLASLRDTGETVTHNPFIAIQQGPVVARYDKRLIGEIESRGIGKQLSTWEASKPIVLQKPAASYRFIRNETLDLAGAVTMYFAEMTSGHASEYSHENPGWQLAWNEFRRTGRPKPINMRIAMQQIIEDDPWMDDPVLDADEALAAADEGLGADW